MEVVIPGQDSLRKERGSVNHIQIQMPAPCLDAATVGSLLMPKVSCCDSQHPHSPSGGKSPTRELHDPDSIASSPQPWFPHLRREQRIDIVEDSLCQYQAEMRVAVPSLGTAERG